MTATTTNYLDYIRESGCIICGHKAEPHHLKAIGMGRNRKMDLYEHYSAIPLCRKHHAEIHELGIKKFCDLHYINVWEIAFELRRNYETQ